MSQQKSFVHHFFSLSVQVQEKNFFTKNCLISENLTKTTFEKANLVYTKYI